MNDPAGEAIQNNPAVMYDKADRNNNFYDNEETIGLPLAALEVTGEVENPGFVDFSDLPVRSVIVKETLLNSDGSDSFVGAYRYDGYSLFDILNYRHPEKKNAGEFRPIIDAYVEIENEAGEKVVVSWGEIYYPNFLHNLLIACGVMRIVPSKTRDMWPLPAVSKLVFANDLITERNISSPCRITVRSCPRQFAVNREMTPLFSDSFNLFIKDRNVDSREDLPAGLQFESLHTIFYGKGRGIHSTKPFTGVFVKEYLAGRVPFNKSNLRQGLLLMVGKDGYRAVYTLNEVINRNDQAAILLVPCPDGTSGGKFRIFPSCDFFSDRAVKALSAIYFDLLCDIHP